MHSVIPSIKNTFKLEEEIQSMEKKFEELVEIIEESFLQRGVSVVKIRRSMKHMRTSLKLQLGDFFQDHTSLLFKADTVEEMFNLLSLFWDYLNPGLFVFIVGRFGSPSDVDLVRMYSEELEVFRKTVKVGEFVRANRTESIACHHYFYKKIITIMGDDWEKETLQDVEDYKTELASELQFQPFLTQIHVRRSSIAIVFSIPHWMRINFEQLKPFFRSKNVVKVSLGDFCVIPDLTKPQVSIACHLVSHKYILSKEITCMASLNGEVFPSTERWDTLFML